MIRKALIGLGMLGIVAGASIGHTASTDLRPYYVVFQCVGAPGGITTGTLEGYVQTQTRYVRISATCNNGPTTKIWPDITQADGEILSITGVVYAKVTNKPGSPVVNESTPCPFTRFNGFVGEICIANPNENTPPGRVDFNISIGPPGQ